MFKVLVVDDEPFVREGLRFIINWCDYGFEICGEAGDGEEGLHLIKELSPDLVITDIRMPEMDGFEFISSSKKIIGAEAQFIVLSGYNDFQYAQKAIKIGVINYLLKPIDEDELIEILKKVGMELTFKKSLEESNSLCLNFDANKIVTSIVKGDVDSHLRKLQDNIFSDIQGFKLRYVEIEINLLEWLEVMSEDEIKSNLNKIKEILIESIYEENFNCVCEEKMGRYGIILSGKILKYYDGKLTRFTNNIMYNIKNVLNCSCFIYIGKEVDRISDIRTSYETCIELRNYKFINSNNVCDYNEIEKITYNYSFNEEIPIERLVEVVENSENNEIQKIINEIFNNIMQQKIAPEIVNGNFMIFISRVIRAIYIRRGDVDGCMKYLTQLKYAGEFDINKIRESLLEFSLESAKYIKSLSVSNQNSVIYEVEKYIKTNYKSDISLKKLAEIFFMNPVYLGKLFKKNLGMYFNDYINFIRIEEAKKLLRRTNLKLSKIANNVGYSDTNYFINKFEKLTQLTPSQYKNMR